MRLRFLGLSLVLAIGGGKAAAGDTQAPDLDRSLGRARSLVEEENWPEAESALRKVFTDFPADPRVRSHLHEIEDELKLSLFRKSLPPIKGTDLFGSAAKAFSPSTREAVLEFTSFEKPLWDEVENGMRIFNVRFEGSFTIDAKTAYIGADRRLPVFVLCYDIEKRGGYAVTAGYYHSDGNSVLHAEPSVEKISATGTKALANSGSGSGGALYDAQSALKISRSAAEIIVKVGTSTVLRCSDDTYKSGYLGFRAPVTSFSIRGRIDRHAYRKIVGERFATKYAEWEKSQYVRERELPEWVRADVIVAPDMTLSAMPLDTPREDRARLASLVESASEGEIASILQLQLEATQAAGDTALYLRAVADLKLDRYGSAARALDLLVEKEPEFVPARLFRALTAFPLRRLEQAKVDIAWVIEKSPRATLAYVSSALISIFEQDLAAAEASLVRADERGAAGTELEEMRTWVHRAVSGPKFAQRFQHETDHFVVTSDHSKKICYDVATLLESMQPQYASAIGTAPKGAPKSRVYVFSGEKGYHDYTADLGMAMDQTGGLYLVPLREVAIWIPIDMTEFTHCARHEGFHQYLHRLVEHAPIWFNEGYADWMGGGGPEGLRNARRDGAIVKKFFPLSRLVAMRQPEFMANAEVCYTQSRYVVDFLRRTKNEKLKDLLRQYLQAAQEGLSQDEANAKVLAPVMDLFQTEFQREL